MRKICYAVFYRTEIAGLVGRSFTLSVFSNAPAAQEHCSYMNDTGLGKYHVEAIEIKPVKVKAKARTK